MAADLKQQPGSVILNAWKAERERERRAQHFTQSQMRPPARRSTLGFAGGAVDRLNMSLSRWSGAINADLDRALCALRAGGRRLGANTSHGRRFLSLVKTNVVGCGPKLQVRAKLTDGKTLDKVANDAVEDHFAKWGKRAEVGGRMGLAHMLRVVVSSVARDGEILVRKVRDRSFPYGMALQLLEADRLDETINRVLDNGNLVRQGVEVDSMLRPVAYYIRSMHPGENYAGMYRPLVERVLVRDCYHLFIQERAEQVRGYTWFHAVLREMDMHYGYKEAALVAARVGAAKMGVLTRKDASTAPALETMADGQDADGVLQMDGEPGEFVEAPAGYELASWDPDYPHENFESFVTTCLRDVSTGLDVAAHNLSGNMTDVNYSSARIAEMAERDMWTMLQDWLAESFLGPLYQDWLASALLMQQVTLPSGKALPFERLEKFADVSKFQGRRWGWVDPLKEASAQDLLIGNALTSRTAIAASQGREYEDIVDELAAEEAYAATKGITLKRPTATAAGAAPAPDAPEEPSATAAKKKPAKAAE